MRTGTFAAPTFLATRTRSIICSLMKMPGDGVSGFSIGHSALLSRASRRASERTVPARASVRIALHAAWAATVGATSAMSVQSRSRQRPRVMGTAAVAAAAEASAVVHPDTASTARSVADRLTSAADVQPVSRAIASNSAPRRSGRADWSSAAIARPSKRSGRISPSRRARRRGDAIVRRFGFDVVLAAQVTDRVEDAGAAAVGDSRAGEIAFASQSAAEDPVDLREHVQRRFLVAGGCLEDVGAGAGEVAEDGAGFGAEEEEGGVKRPIPDRLCESKSFVAKVADLLGPGCSHPNASLCDTAPQFRRTTGQD